MMSQDNLKASFSFIVSVLALFSMMVTVVDMSGKSDAAAIVGDVTISLSEVQQNYNQLPPEFQQQFSQSEILRQLIEKQLVLLEAEDRGIDVSDEDVDAYIDEQVATFGISYQELEMTLAAANVTIVEYQDAVREEMILRAFLEEVIMNSVSTLPSDEQQQATIDAFEALIEDLTEKYGVWVNPDVE